MCQCNCNIELRSVQRLQLRMKMRLLLLLVLPRLESGSTQAQSFRRLQQSETEFAVESREVCM